MARDAGRLVVIGEILRGRGLRGELRVAPLTDHPRRFEALRRCVLWDLARDVREEREIVGARVVQDAVLLTVAGCETPEAARALAGRLVALPASEALPPPPGQFYPWQLEGCRVLTEDGLEVGAVARVEPGPAHELWVVRGPEREHLIPAVAEIVREVDLEARRVVIRPPQGLLEL